MNQTHDMPQTLIFDEEDSLLRMTVCNHEARILMCRTTRLAQAAADIHLASDAGAAAMGRLLPAAAMMGAMLKEENGNVTVTVAGDGVGGKMTAVAFGENLKITVDHPQAEVEPLADGRQDVPGFVGTQGRLTVIKDMGQGEPYVGTSQLVSGGLGEDFARYFTVSEQTPSIVSLGCLNQNGQVLSSGGILVQALPGCSEETLQMLEMRIPFFSNISREIYDRSLITLCESWFSGMDLKVLSSHPLHYRCDCSREKMEKALLASGQTELEQMIAEGKDVEMTCWFCREHQAFTPGDIAGLMKNAKQV